MSLSVILLPELSLNETYRFCGLDEIMYSDIKALGFSNLTTKIGFIL